MREVLSIFFVGTSLFCIIFTIFKKIIFYTIKIKFTKLQKFLFGLLGLVLFFLALETYGITDVYDFIPDIFLPLLEKDL